MNKILFILKRREDYNATLHSAVGLSTGLYNSASFMNDMLNDMGIPSNLVVVTDNNDIDREVTKYKPTHVIIEALWVVPQKFVVLQKLHPNVIWIVRYHSELPFLAGEGMAMDWTADYLSYPNVYLGVNAPRMMDELRLYATCKYGEKAVDKIIYMPNYYPQDYKPCNKMDKNSPYINIGCFGAVRPLKNHMNQALAAIKFAESIGKKLRFHINSGRLEMKGEPVMHNLRATFMQLGEKGHELINHTWTPREQFLETCAEMDIGMQVSFSETFNIVGADLISQGVPLVGSSEIPWISCMFSASATETGDIYNALRKTYNSPKLNIWTNQFNLKSYTNKTKKIWYNLFKD